MGGICMPDVKCRRRRVYGADNRELTIFGEGNPAGAGAGGDRPDAGPRRRERLVWRRNRRARDL